MEDSEGPLAFEANCPFWSLGCLYLNALATCAIKCATCAAPALPLLRPVHPLSALAPSVSCKVVQAKKILCLSQAWPNRETGSVPLKHPFNVDWIQRTIVR